MSVPRAERPGSVVPAPRIPGIDLPPGRPILVDPDFADHPPDGPVGWMSDAPVERGWATWLALRARFPQTGLWPVLLEGLDDGDLQRPWGDGELDPVPVARVDALGDGAFAELWDEVEGDADEDTAEYDARTLAPFGGGFPGLAVPPAGAVAMGDLPISDQPSHIGLIPATRAADVPALVGWSGPANFTTTDYISAVLRSWEDRFGAELVSLGFATLVVAVSRIPTTIDEALPIAAEHYAFCPDNVWQGTETIQALAEALVDAPAWSFWWD